MARSVLARLTTGVLAALAAPAVASATALGPSPYLQFADSPFAGGAFAWFHLEDFENGALDVPGVAASVGSVLAPGSLTDSVDGDDGAIDGIGAGASFYVTADSITFTFDPSVLGALPTHVGFVFTDVGFSFGTDGFGNLRFASFDANGDPLHSIGPALVGDGLFNRQTAEDRFFGAIHAGGISRIVIEIDSDDWELDHLQFGREVPEPGIPALLGVSLLLLRRRR
jgi:hypothetical protein